METVNPMMDNMYIAPYYSYMRNKNGLFIKRLSAAFSLLSCLYFNACRTHTPQNPAVAPLRIAIQEAQWEDVLVQATTFIQQHPDAAEVPEAHFAIVQALFTLGRFEESIAEVGIFERRFSDGPYLLKAQIIGASAHHARGENATAVQRLLEISQVRQTTSSDFKTALETGRLLAEWSLPVESERAIRNVIEQARSTEPGLGEAHYWLALVLEAQGKYADALIELDVALPASKTAADRGGILVARARVLAALNNTIEAIVDADRALPDLGGTRLTEAQQLLNSLIEQLSADTNFDGLSQMISNAGTIAKLHLRKADLFISNGLFEEADEEIQSATRLSQDVDVSEKATTLSSITERARSSYLPKIGLLLPLSGKLSSFAHHALVGAQLALTLSREVFPALDIVLIRRDTTADPEIAVSEFENLVTEDHVLAVVGPLTSAELHPLISYLDDFRVPLITPGAAEKGLTRQSPFLFRDCPTREAEGMAMAQFAIQHLRLRQFAVIYPDTAYGESLAVGFINGVELFHGDLVTKSIFQHGITDFRPVLAPLIAAKSHFAKPKSLVATQTDAGKPILQEIEEQPIAGIYIPDFAPYAGMVIPQVILEELDGARFLGSSGWNSEDLVSIAGEHVEGSYFTTTYYPVDHAGWFSQAYAERFEGTPHPLTIQTFEAVWLIAQAAAQGADNRETLRLALQSGENLRGIFGPIVINPDGDVLNPFFVMQVRNGTFELAAEIVPHSSSIEVRDLSNEQQ